ASKSANKVGALQTLLRPKTRTFTPYVSCPQCAKPHTGEKVNPSLRGVQSIPAGFAPREARCSLSPREKVRLRGHGANYSLEYRTISGTVEPGAGGFYNRLYPAALVQSPDRCLPRQRLYLID